MAWNRYSDEREALRKGHQAVIFEGDNHFIVTVDNNTDNYIRVGKSYYEKGSGKGRGNDWRGVLFALTAEVKRWLEQPNPREIANDMIRLQTEMANIRQRAYDVGREAQLDEEKLTGEVKVEQNLDMMGYRRTYFKVAGETVAEVHQRWSDSLGAWKESSVSIRCHAMDVRWGKGMVKAVEMAFDLAGKWDATDAEKRQADAKAKAEKDAERLAVIERMEDEAIVLNKEHQAR